MNPPFAFVRSILSSSRLGASLLVVCSTLSTAQAQAPAAYSDVTNKVLTVTVSNFSAFAVGAVRFFANGTTLLSGNFFLTGSGFGPTNVTYTQQAPDRGLLRFTSTPGASYLETNNLTLAFATATDGVFTNQMIRPGLPLQTNTGTFKLTAGTNILPVVAVQSPSQILQSNTTINLSITAAGFELKYQWRLNGTNLPGASAQTNTYALNNLSPASAGNYTCVISNAVGAITTAPINISIATPITITQHPQSQDILEGSYLSLSVAATGSIASYNWYRGAISLFSQTNRTLIIPITAATDAGNYTCYIGGYGQTPTTQVATVTIRKPGSEATWLGRPFVKVADQTTRVPDATNHLFFNWANAAATPLLTFRDGKIHFVAGTSTGVRSLFRWTNGTLSTLVFTNTPNPLGGFFRDLFYPTDEGAGVVNFTGTGQGMFAWSNGVVSNVLNTNTPARTNGATTNYFGIPGSYSRRGNSVAISSSIFSAPGSFNIVGNGIFFQNGSTLTRICDDTSDLPGVMTGYGVRPTANSINFDGTTLVFTTTNAPTTPGTQLGGFFKATPGGAITKLADTTDTRPDNGQLYGFLNDIDVDGEMIFAIVNGTVFAWETNGSVTNVGIASFISASGPRQVYMGYAISVDRWNNGVQENVLKSGSLVDGKQIQQILAADGQGDDVAVVLRFTDNTYGIYIAYGQAVTAPTIINQPMDFNVIDTGTASFYVSALGQVPLRYQWWKGTGPLVGQTNSSLVISNVQALDVASYSVVVSNDNSSVTSRVAQLTRTVPDVPIILSGPAGVNAFFGSNATFNVRAVGVPPLNYTWHHNLVPLVPGTNGSTLTVTNVGATNLGFYSVIVSNANGSTTSPGAVLQILPVITQRPVSVTNSVGGTASFTVQAIGIPPLTYAWRRTAPVPAFNLVGQTNNSLTFSNLVLTNAGTYLVTVSSGSGVIAVGATLTVTSGSQADAPVLQLPALNGGQFEFRLPTQTGFSYVVQSKTNLSDTNWTQEQVVPGDGTTKTVTVNTTAPVKFLRVIAQ